MVARRLTTILPAMTLAEALETIRLPCGANRWTTESLQLLVRKYWFRFPPI
jgi:hypothetical protein